MRIRFLMPAVLVSFTFVRPATCESPTTSETPKFRAARVFVTDSQSWEIGGSGGGSVDGFGQAASGGARPQTAEIIKTFGQRCPQVVMNNKKDASDYVVVLDHEGGKSLILRKNKVVVFDRRSGDLVVSRSTRSLGNSVQDACQVIIKHWQENGAEMRSADLHSTPIAGTMNGHTHAKLNISSMPDGAEIEVDGAFMGHAPSILELAPGEHTVTLRKNGYRMWERRLRITGGEIRLNGEMERIPQRAAM